MEVLDEDANNTVDRGWGTFMTNPAPVRELNFHISHPVSCTNTEIQGVSLFKLTNGRSYLMAGAHREANGASSPCQSSYAESDAAHNVANLFQPAVEELMSYYDGTGADYAVFQFHAMAPTTCPGVDVYITRGLSLAPEPGDTIRNLKDNLISHHPGWIVTVPGDSPSCTMNGTTNVQGRVLNGVEAGLVCTMAATSSTGRFVYVEQKLAFREASDWIDPILDTWP
jgi:hypothetical protein